MLFIFSFHLGFISLLLCIFLILLLCLCITLAETYVRQGKYVEAVKIFEKEIYRITGDLDLDSISNSTESSSSKNVIEAKGENKTITIESVKELEKKVGNEEEEEKKVGKNSTEVNLDEINAENKKQNSSLSNPLLPTTSNSSSTSNETSTSTSSTKRSYTEEFHKNEIKVLTTIEKNKLKLLHMRLGNMYGNHLLDLKLAAYNYEKTLEYGGDMNKEIRMFFAKNAHDLETLKKDEIEIKIKMGVNPGVGGTKKVNVSLSDHISNVLNNSSDKNQTKGSGNINEKVQVPIPSVPSGDGKQTKGPKTGPAVPSRRNRWVVRSDVIEENGAQGGGPGVHAGVGEGSGAGAVGGMKMGGMGKINGGGGEEAAERGEGEAQRQGGAGGGGGGASGESSFESQIRRKEELQEAEEEERIRTGTSASAGAETGTTTSAVLSALSSSRRGR